ncbi:guanylate kinase [Candidatus Mycoplasma pogonae]
MKKNKIIIFSGPSGVGKGTIEKFLFKNKDLRLRLSRSLTTRNPREGEEDGVHYFFISKEEFQNKIANKELVEWSEHFGNYYGTLNSEVETILLANHNPFLEIETWGAIQVLEYYTKMGKIDEVISIFLLPPSLEELEERIRKRGTENEEQIHLRLLKAQEELTHIRHFKYFIVNQAIEKAAQEIATIIKKELDED